MKKIILLLVVLFLSINSTAIKVYGKELTAPQIVDKMNEAINPDSAKAKFKMTIITTSGQERTFIYNSFAKDRGEKNLIRYLEPKRAKGQAILMLNNADDIWAYFPRTKRVRKLATHAKRQKMEGSDFSYEDMGSGDAFINDYESKLLGEEKKEDYNCYKIELRRKKESDAGYSRLIMWVIKDNFFPVVMNYYDRDDPDFLRKVLVQYDIKEIDGIPTGMKIIMYNKRDNTNTSMEILEIKYNVNLNDSVFSERNLKK